MKKQRYISLAEIQARPLSPEFDTISGPLPHNLLNDLMFRLVFETNQEALKSLLCSLLHLKESDIISIEIRNPIRFGKRVKDKKYIYDIFLLLNDQQKIHLELQVLQQDFWADRSLCYLCREFGGLNSGENYDLIQPLIQIDILDFSLYKDSKEFYSVYHMANDKTGRIYSDKLSLHVLELEKEEYATEEDKAYGIDHWARLFKATTWEEIKMLAQEQKVLQSTVETMYRITADDYVAAELQAREDELRLQRTIQQKHEREIKQLTDLLADKDAMIFNQNAALANKDAALADKDAMISNQNVALANAQAEIEHLKALLKQQK